MGALFRERQQEVKLQAVGWQQHLVVVVARAPFPFAGDNCIPLQTYPRRAHHTHPRPLQMLFAGFFIRTSQIPVFLRWAQYVCVLKYSINLLLNV